MLEYEILLFGLLGFLSSMTIAFFATERDIKTAVLLAFQGVITGWLSGIAWVVLTGGLEVTLFSLIIPVIISAGVSYIILYYAPDRLIDNRPVDDKVTTGSAALLFLLVFAVAFSSIPVAFNTSVNTQQFDISALDWCDCEETVTDIATVYPSNIIPMTIQSSKTSITGVSFAENPAVGNYMDFKIYFQPYTLWEQPYIKIGVFKDNDNNGVLSIGDERWSDINYKVATGPSLWRPNCIWENGQPTFEVTNANGEMLPVFHAQTVTMALDETGKTLRNTPEKFTPQSDMISWDSTGIRDQIIQYASVSPGETTTIQGKIYCNTNSAGNHYILVRAYDAKTSDPFTESAPIQEETIPFRVTPQVEPIALAGITLTGGILILMAIFGMVIIFLIATIIKGGKLW